MVAFSSVETSAFYVLLSLLVETPVNMDVFVLITFGIGVFDIAVTVIINVYVLVSVG